MSGRRRRDEDEGDGSGGGGGGSGAGSRAKKSKKPQVMDASGQTVEERRQLRLEQRLLKTQIIEQQTELGDITKENCRNLTEKAGLLFEKTKFPREAVADGENLKLIAEGSAAQAKKVNAGSVGIDGEQFMERLREVYSKGKGGDGEEMNHFNWAKWGMSVSTVFLTLPDGGGFMMGPLDKPAKERKAAQRKEKIVDNYKEVRPDEETGKGNKSKQIKDQTQMRIAQMRAHFEEDPERSEAKKDMFETLVNPKSFTQTVENLFDYSFFVKSGEGHISMNPETKLPEIKFTPVLDAGDERERSQAPPNKQWLMSFTPADFKELTRLYNMQESHLGHRDEGPKSDYYDPLKHGNRESNRQ